jgi:hypothetical protein
MYIGVISRQICKPAGYFEKDMRFLIRIKHIALAKLLIIFLNFKIKARTFFQTLIIIRLTALGADEIAPVDSGAI